MIEQLNPETSRCALKRLRLNCFVDADCDGYDDECPSYTTMKQINEHYYKYSLDMEE